MSLAHASLNGTVSSPFCQYLSPTPISYLAHSSFPPSKPSSYAVIDSTIPYSRLFETEQGEILLISKTPAEIAGEKLLKPLVDTVHQLTSKIAFSSLASSALSFGTSCLSFIQSLPLPHLVPLFPVASAQLSDLATTSHKEQEEDPQDLLIEVPTSAFPTWQKVESFASIPLKSPSSKELPSSAEAPPQSLSLLPPALFTKILVSPNDIDWSSPEIDKTSLVAIRDSWNRSIFLAAIEEGRKEVVEILLAQNIAVHTVDSHGNNGLALAALNGYAGLISLLSDHFPINSYNAQGMTPIHQAIKQGHSQVVQALVRNGASLTIGYKSSEGVLFSPAALAVQSGDILTLEVLIKEDYQTDVDLTQSIAGIGTLVHLAIHTDQTPMLQYLLETQHAFTQRLLEHEDFLGRTPLHLASYVGNLPAIRFLVRQGADIERSDRENGRKPIHFAALGKQPEAICLLDWLDANLESTDKEGRTPKVLLNSQLDQLKEEEALPANDCLALLDKLPHIAKKYKTKPPDFSRRLPTNLVLQGGGPKGMAYIGAIRKMEALHTFIEVRRIAGSSAGAITAILLSVGYNSRELETFLSRNFIDLLDGEGEIENSFTAELEESLKAILRDYWQGWKTVAKPVRTAKEFYKNLFTLSTITGFSKGEALREWMDSLIQQATKTKEHPKGIEHCTFEELHDLVLKYPGKYRDPYIFSIPFGKLDSSDITCFSHEDPRWKSLIISDAVRASVSIPIVFKPHILHLKDPIGTRYPVKSYGKFVDGGLIRSFPLEAFDDNRYQQNKRDWGGATNRRTLGLHLRITSGITPEQIDTIESTKDLLQALVSTYFYAEEMLVHEKSYNQNRTIPISIKNIELMDGDVDESRKQTMIRSGEEAVHSFFEIVQEHESVVDPIRARDIRLSSPHPDFVGRKGYLESLEEAFVINPREWDPRSPIKVRLLWGLGGMGKSELAIRFANSHLSDFSIIWMIRYESEAAVDQGYRDLAQRLKVFIEDKTPSEQIRRKVHSYLENNPFEKPWLLLLDNVESQIKQQDFPERGGVVLITARHSFVRTSAGEKIKVEGFSQEEAIALLVKITGEEESEEMGWLVGDLGGFPLALNQAAHYIKDTSTSSIARYREVYHLAKDPLQGPVSEDDRYQYTLRTVWNVTFERLQKDFPKTIAWLESCAYLAPAEIPVNWLERWAGGIVESEEILRTLEQYALMKYDRVEKGLFLHNLLQAVIQERTSKSDDVAEKKDTLLTFISQIGEGLDINQLKDWNPLAKWEPHAVHVIQFSCILTQKGNILSKLGLWFLEKGKYQEALKSFEETLKLKKKFLGEEHLEIATSLDNKGSSLYALGKHEEALAAKKAALAMRQKLLRDEHPDVAKSLNSVGISLFGMGKYEEALAAKKAALAMRQKLLGDEHPDVAKSLNSVGASLFAMGKYEEALVFFKAAFAMRQKLLGNEHPEVAISLNNIGLSLDALGRHEEALASFEKVLAMRQKLLGSEHPEVATSLNNMGLSLDNLGSHEKALTVKRAASVMYKKLLGEEHPYVAKSLNNIGLSLNALGKYEEALISCKAALVIYEKLLGEEHPYIARSLNNMGLSLNALGRHEEAHTFFSAAFAMYKKLLREEHSDMARSLNGMGLSLYALGRYEEALVSYKEAFKMACRTLPQTHPKIIDYLGSAIYTLNQLADQTLIEATKTELYLLCVKVFGKDHKLVQQLISAGKEKSSAS